MNVMTAPLFSINNILQSLSDKDDLRDQLFNMGVYSKDYVEDGLLLLYHKYDVPITSELQRECRSLVVDKKTLKMKSYSCETPRLNKEGMEFLLGHSSYPKLLTKCYEGTLLSLFNHNGKWYVSTRRCLDSNESVLNNDGSKSHYEMFEEVLKKSGYETFSNFTETLDVNKSYYFVLIHYLNKHIIDYTLQFGEKYSKLCLTSIRDENMNELDIYTDKLSFISYDEKDNIFVAPEVESLEEFSTINKLLKYTATPESEGVIVRVWDTKLNRNHLIKLQYMNYQFAQVIGSDRNIFKGLVYLYQNDKLIDYFVQNVNSQTIKKVVNPLNTSESYDTIGMVDAVFKVCTSELFELFKLLWSLKTGKHQNTDLYNLLPKEYKDLMYNIRGLYYKKKAKLSTGVVDIKETYLRVNDIYNCLKGLPTEQFIAFIRMRRLMLNWVKQNMTNTHLQEFSKISMNSDKVHMKLCAIFTNKLFPEILPTDVPPQVK